YWTCSAFLARLYLYNGDWESAKKESMDLISKGPFVLEESLDQVFLTSSNETIWQLDVGNPGYNSSEGATFIITTAPPRNSCLTLDFIDSFEFGDQRKMEWVGS